jgi:hypothetical protein
VNRATEALEHYTQLAEIHGARSAWELGSGNGLLPRELGRLAARLRAFEPATRVDARGYRVPVEPRFKLTSKEKRWLASLLIADGVDDRQIRMWTAISRSTLWRVHQDREQQVHAPVTLPSEPHGNAVSGVSKSPPESHRSYLPVLSFDGSSGSDLEADAIRRLLA